MLSITARNVNDAYQEGLWRMRILGKDADSRNGLVRRIPGPVVTTYKRPTERMLFDPVRDANPYFHIMEGIWMLAGSKDVTFLEKYNSTIGQFSDDGKTLGGAYGHRWRNHWDDDQLVWVIEHLRNNPTSRRAVLQMYDPVTDQYNTARGGKDIPCNTAVYFGIDGGELNMTVTCRSNDMIWGCYGANAVHMSMLQEFVADALGVAVGRYVQFSNDFHMYERHFELLYKPSEDPVGYPLSHIHLTNSHNWGPHLNEFEEWVDGSALFNSHNPFIKGVLNPMDCSWEQYKQGNREEAEYWAATIADHAIAKACVGWLGRRLWK